MNHHWQKHPEHLPRGRRFVFWGFAALFGGLSLLFLLGVATVIYLAFGPLSQHLSRPGSAVLLGLCVVPFVFIFLSSLLGALGFRRFGRPLADLVTGIEAVARGDLSVRLKEHGPGQVRGLARRFNHMAGELERAEQQRRNLTADIAHELRTPLHVIQGNLEGMLDGVYEPNRENLSATLDETRLLARLVTDLQTLSLAEAGQLPLHPTRFLCSDLLADVAASFAPQAAEQGVDLAVEAAETLELNADYDRLDQVLSNLVANALRFTPSGGKITLRAEAASSLARITVADTGSGIPAEDLPFVFDRFWKADRSRTRGGSSGSGLGLAIARQLVRAHGGTIEVSSQPGQGTVFTIELEIAQ